MAKKPIEPPDGILLSILPFEYAEQIGLVVAAWARLEYDIDEMVWDLAEIEDGNVGACLTAQFSTVNARLNALIALARLKRYSEFHIAKLNRFRERATALADRRNRVAHDPWLSTFEGGSWPPKQTYRLQKTARAKLDHTYKPVTLDELKKLREEIEDAIKQFDVILSGGGSSL